MNTWVTEVEIERRNRIRLSVAALGYEKYSRSFLSDAEFDALSKSIRPNMDTGNSKLDTFFRTQFSPFTGQWIHKHPDKENLERIWKDHYDSIST